MATFLAPENATALSAEATACASATASDCVQQGQHMALMRMRAAGSWPSTNVK